MSIILVLFGFNYTVTSWIEPQNPSQNLIKNGLLPFQYIDLNPSLGFESIDSSSMLLQ